MEYKQFLQFHRECCDEMSSSVVKNPPQFEIFHDFVALLESCGTWDLAKVTEIKAALLADANRKIILACYLKSLEAEQEGDKKAEDPVIDTEPTVEPDPEIDIDIPTVAEKKIPSAPVRPVEPPKPSDHVLRAPAPPKRTMQEALKKVSSPIIY